MGMNEFMDFIKKSNIVPKVIFDVGSRDCLEAIEISKQYPESSIYAFECHPKSYLNCLENSKNYKNITVINKAVNDYNGKCRFYPTNPDKTITTWKDGNPGASSLFKASGAYDNIEKYVQDEIEVECCKLETFCNNNSIKNVDAIWMDLQGAELLALKSLGDYLKNVQIVHTELEINEMYENQCLFKDVDPFLKSFGFKMVWGNTSVHFGTDFIYVR